MLVFVGVFAGVLLSVVTASAASVLPAVTDSASVPQIVVTHV